VNAGGSGSVSAPARLVLVGVRGFGQVHAERIARLTDQGLVELVAAVDPGVVLDPPVIYGAPLYADLGDALAAVGPVDVVVIAAPLGAHFTLARTALSAGADVYLEKPPVTSLDDFTQLLELERETGRVVQVGFQSLGSQAIEMLRTDAFEIGPVVRAGAVGAWSRTVGYWTRSSWSGRRSLRGQAVVDGVATNALAHAVVTALAVVGCRALEDVQAVETDLYRASAIDCDDTSAVRVRTTSGLDVTCALTLSAPVQREPEVHVEGRNGSVRFGYTTDRIEVDRDGRSQSEVTGRTDLVENLLAHRRDGSPLLVPLASTGAFMRVLAAIAAAEEPIRVDPRAVRWEGEGSDRRAIVDDIETWLAEAVTTGRTFTELGAPWTHRERDRVLLRAEVAGVEVARYRDGRGTIPTSSPRPVLHPVRSLAGVVLTARHPADHDWHVGIGVAIPDVNGSSFWGGGTYVHGQGYLLLDNHGQIVGSAPEAEGDGFRQRLDWLGHDGSTELREERSVRWAGLDERTWRLTVEFTLSADAMATLHSPGSKGRAGGGYGGFFWRFPECADVDVHAADAQGEDDVHGHVAPWLAWSADFAAGPGVSGPATVVVAAAGAAAAGEPWFVRVRDYPGLGSALAWDQPVVLQPGEVLSRRFDIAIADGRLTTAQAASLAGELLVGQD
jgi:predicted dehydrogenase